MPCHSTLLLLHPYTPFTGYHHQCVASLSQNALWSKNCSNGSLSHVANKFETRKTTTTIGATMFHFHTHQHINQKSTVACYCITKILPLIRLFYSMHLNRKNKSEIGKIICNEKSVNLFLWRTLEARVESRQFHRRSNRQTGQCPLCRRSFALFDHRNRICRAPIFPSLRWLPTCHGSNRIPAEEKKEMKECFSIFWVFDVSWRVGMDA